MHAILAVDSCNGLSKNGNIPWNCKKDMSFFVKITKGNCILMGSNTYKSINSPLKDRLNIVLTNKPEQYIFSDENNSNIIFTNNSSIYETIYNDKSTYCELYKYLKKDFQIIIIGGKQIYAQFIPMCSIIWLSVIKGDYNCDLHFDITPYISENYKKELYYQDDELNIYCFTRL
jgi:dihydrofolate reductase